MIVDTRLVDRRRAASGRSQLCSDAAVTLSTPARETSPGTMATAVRALLVGGFIYLFLIGVSALEQGIEVMGQDTRSSCSPQCRIPSPV